MSRVMSQEEIQQALSRAQQQPSERTERPSPTGPLPDGICLSNRPRMPVGWLNSIEGHKWMQKRAEAFSRMNANGRMNFGFLPKNSK